MRLSASATWLATGLLLVYWAGRLLSLAAFPPFIDEAVHLNFARNILNSGPFAYADEGRQFILWLYALFGAPANAPYWTARAANLIVLLPGFAALLGTGRLLAGRWGMLFAGLLLFNPFHHFFERLALADPVSSAAILLAIYFAARLSKRLSLWDAAWCGTALFLAYGAKVSALPYFALPLFAAVAFRRDRSGARWAGTALAVACGLTGAYVGVLIWRGYNPFFHLATGTSLPRLQILLTNAGTAANVLVEYFGLVVALGLAVGMGALALRGRLFLPLAFLLPLGVLLLSPRMDSRYLIPPITILLLGGAVALGGLVTRRPALRLLALAALLCWGLIGWLPFAWTAARSPANIPLPPNDREYVNAEGTGFGIAELLTALNQHQPTRVIGIFANCLSLRDLAPFPVECPRLNPNGEDVQPLSDLLEASRAAGVYAVLEAVSYAPSEAPGTLVDVIDHQRPRLSVYELAP